MFTADTRIDGSTSSTQELLDVALGLARVELEHARAISWSLPEIEDFEEHARAGLAIGACGRRIEALLDTFPLRVRDADDEMVIGALLPPSDKAESDFPSTIALYKTVSNALKPLGLLAYDLLQAVGVCMQLSIDDSYCLIPPLGVCGTSFMEYLRKVGESCRVAKDVHPTRARRGNERKLHDPRWCFFTQAQPLPRMRRIEEPRGLLQKLHHTAFRETVASEIVGLNLYEYDGLPWAFYVDMARQAEDESRHSLLMARLLHERGGDFAAFPLPYMGSYYELFWEMTLTERLVGLNLDIEAVGHAVLSNISDRLVNAGDFRAGEAFEFIARDERRHARIGSDWLRYLYPDVGTRRHAVEAARALTAVSMAVASTRITGGTTLETIDRWLDGETLLHYDEPLSAGHEHEVTPLTARKRGGEAADKSLVG